MTKDEMERLENERLEKVVERINELRALEKAGKLPKGPRSRFVHDTPMLFLYKGQEVSAEEYLKLKEADEQEGKGNA